MLRWLNFGRRPATRVLVVDLHDLLAGRLVTGLWLGCWLRIGCLSLAAAHQTNRTTPPTVIA